MRHVGRYKGGNGYGDQKGETIKVKTNIFLQHFFFNKSNFYVHIPTRKDNFHFYIISFQKAWYKHQLQG